MAGVALPDAVLFRESADDHARRDRRAGELLAEAGQIEPRRLTAQERATLALLQRELSGLRAQHAVDSHLRPWLFPAGPDFTAMFWANSTSVGDATTATLYVERLATLPGYLRDVQANIEAGHARGYRYPRVVLQAAAANTRGILAAAPEASAWLSPFKRSAGGSAAGRASPAGRALAFVREALMPALQAWADFPRGPAGAWRARVAQLQSTARPVPRTTAPGCALHQPADRPDDVHTLGLAEVARIGAEIEAVAADAGFAGRLADYRHFLATDPQFIAPSADALRTSVEALCKRVDRRIPEFFGLIPRITYGVQSIPKQCRRACRRPMRSPARPTAPPPASSGSAACRRRRRATCTRRSSCTKPGRAT
jgi:uncharacterized protein (DUF885 family)